ncbi:MAG: alkaline phosphatase family protein [Acidobacteriota bacterium]
MGANTATSRESAPHPYLWILTCAGPAGVYFAIAIVALLLYVNPYLAASAEVVGHLCFYLLPIYGAAATAIVVALLATLHRLGFPRARPFARRAFDPVLSAWLLLANLAALAAIYWANFDGCEDVLSPRQRAHLLRASVGLSSALGAGILALVVHWLSPPSRRLLRWLFVFLALAVLVFLFGQRRESLGSPSRRNRIVLDVVAAGTPMTVVAIDGLSLDLLRPLEAKGDLPTFSKLLSEGAAVRLSTVLPCEPIVTWTTVATGKLPHRHGICGNFSFTLPGLTESFHNAPRAVLFRKLRALGILKATPITRADRDALAFWNVIARAGVKVGVANWPATFPAEPIRGAIVSDYVGRPQFQLGQGLSNVTFPERLAPLVLAHRVRSQDVPGALLAELLPKSGAPVPNEAELRAILRDARARDATSRATARLLAARDRPTVLALRFDGLESILRSFLRYHDPQAFGNVSAKERERYGRVVSGYFGLLDDLVGEELDRLPQGGILVVLSASGMVPAPLWERALYRGDAVLSGTRRAGPDGAMLVWGKGIEPGASLTGKRLVDVAPTLLYAQGLPIPRDMDGDPLFELFTDDYKSRTPVSSIASYEAARIGSAASRAQQRPLQATGRTPPPGGGKPSDPR